jgi:hypothetical protein
MAEAVISGDDTYEASKFFNNTKHMEHLLATFLERYCETINTQRFNCKLLCTKISIILLGDCFYNLFHQYCLLCQIITL